MRQVCRGARLARAVLWGRQEAFMFDVLLVLITVAFFGLSWAYARFCERL